MESQMSLNIYYRAPRQEGQKNRPYVAIKEKRGVKTSGYAAPLYVRRNRGWHRLSAQAFAEAQRERDSIENGKTAVATDGHVTLKTAVDQFLDMKKRKTESTVQNYTYILNEFLVKTRAKFVDEFQDQKNGRRLFDEFISVLEKGGARPKTIENKVMVVVFMLCEAGIEKPFRGSV
jgi:hypothetical protein